MAQPAHLDHVAAPGSVGLPTGPLSFGRFRNPDQRRCRQPIAVEVRGTSAQMKLPDHPDALPRQQPPRDRFHKCRLFHSANHFLVRFLDEMVPRVGFEPTTYRLRSGCSTAELPGQRPGRDHGANRIGFSF